MLRCTRRGSGRHVNQRRWFTPFFKTGKKKKKEKNGLHGSLFRFSSRIPGCRFKSTHANLK